MSSRWVVASPGLRLSAILFGVLVLAWRRFLHGPFQGTLGMAGTVHADDDSRHFLLLLP